MNPCEDCHRPVGVHCCHNCKKDANKCKEYHGCGSCNAWEQGIFTNADRIRAMSDEELAVFLCGFDKEELARATEYALERRKITEWLKQPAEVDNG